MLTSEIRATRDSMIPKDHQASRPVDMCTRARVESLTMMRNAHSGSCGR
jgi:hypothetical protein